MSNGFDNMNPFGFVLPYLPGGGLVNPETTPGDDTTPSNPIIETSTYDTLWPGIPEMGALIPHQGN